MDKRAKYKHILLRTISYILVAALSSFLTMLLTGNVNKLAQLEWIIKTHFVGEVDETAMGDAAASAMIGALGDRWSYYISAEDYEAFQEKKTNSYVGIGITIQQREDKTGFDILKVEPDGPAERAGIQAGDILVEVEGTSMADVNSDVPSSMIRGIPGTSVQVAVLRQGEKLEFQVRRAKVESVVAEGRMLDHKIGYVKIRNFNTNCADQTLAAVEALLEQGAQALLFDVRNNSGGYVDEMNEILDYLLPEGDLFRSVRYNGQEEVDTSDADCLEVPMAVLVNEYSYSAAEFFAAALQEYDWAVVVGTPTTGKGYFQNTFNLVDGSAVGLSVGQYYTPNGISLAEQGGMTPDVTVEVDEETFYMIYAEALPVSEDPQLLQAQNLLNEEMSAQ